MVAKKAVVAEGLEIKCVDNKLQIKVKTPFSSVENFVKVYRNDKDQWNCGTLGNKKEQYPNGMWKIQTGQKPGDICYKPPGINWGGGVAGGVQLFYLDSKGWNFWKQGNMTSDWSKLSTIIPTHTTSTGECKI